MANLDTVFKAYDIRGLVPQELDADVAYKVGRALADFLPNGSVAVGRDMREQSAELAQALTRGLIEQGRTILDLGQCTSDMLYFVIGDMQLAGGAMITASHNAAGYNGIKLTGSGVVPIGAGTGLEKIKQAVQNNHFAAAKTPGHSDQINRTSDFVKHAIKVAQPFGELGPLNIGYDAGNGMAGIFVEYLQKLTPLKIEGLYLKPDGSFPNHPANPMEPKNLTDLKQLETKDHLQAGVAFDGDGDRAFLVDEKGEILTASTLGALLIEHVLKANPGAKIVYDAVVSRIVLETIEHHGGVPISCRTGHVFIKAKMHEVGAIFGLEHSGHFYFVDNFGADSGLIAALAGLGVLAASQQTLSELTQPFKQYVQIPEQNFAINDTPALLQELWHHFNDGQVHEIDGLSIDYPDWWFNVRSSNTEPVVRLNIEAKNKTILSSKQDEITEIITKYLTK